MPSLEPHPNLNGIADHQDPSPHHTTYHSTRDDALPQLTNNVYKPGQRQRPMVSTNIPPRGNHIGLITPQDDNSPDPHDFYRLGQEQRAGDGANDGGGRSTPRTSVSKGSRRSRPNSPRSTNDPSRTISPIGPRVSNARHVLSSRQERTPLSAAKSSPTLANAPRNRQTSLKELVNKFNQTPDEVPPVPTKSTSRSPSASSSIRAPFNNWSGSGSQISTPSRGYSGSFSSDGPNISGVKAHNQRRGRAVAESPISPRSKNNSTMGQIKQAPVTSQSMTDLANDDSPLPRKPLFGELFASSPSQPPVGYGIPGPKRRRGSEGSMNSPNPLYADPTYLRHRDPSPSSSAAWYYEHAPPLDEIKAKGDLPDHPAHIHRRTRSEAKAFSTEPIHHQKYTNALSPPSSPLATVPSSPLATDGSRRSSLSRIPISTRRISATSESEHLKSPTQNHAPRNSKPPKSSTRNRAPPPNPLRTSPKYSRSNTPQKSPRYQGGNNRPASSPRLAAYISEPLPKKSPPLRSSRPRQPVSSASTSASRAKAVEKFGTDNSRYPNDRDSRPRRLPELGAVDFAARRQKIQLAFTKTVKEEEEREIRRLSLAQENQPANLPLHPKAEEVLSIPEESVQENFKPRVEDDSGSSDGSRDSQLSEPELTVNTAQRTERSVLDLEDSPTLGTFHTNFAAENSSKRRHDSSPNSDIDPGSANTVETSDSVDTFFDDEPQDGPAESPTAQKATLPSISMSTSNADSTHPKKVDGIGGVDEADSGDDRESIQIMLGATPVLDKATFNDESEDRSKDQTSSDGPDSRWSVSTWTSSIRSDERDSLLDPIHEKEAHRADAPAHLSFSSTASEQTPTNWSPSSNGSMKTDRTTMESDRYNTINRVLDQYHERGREAPPEIQQQIYNQSPDLMRQGGYDPRKVTQLYLQKMAQDRVGGTAESSKVHLNKRTSSLQPLPQIISEKEVRTDMNEKMLPGPSHSRNLSASTANDQDIDEDGNLKPARASLSRPDDFDMSPSLGGFTEMAADTPSEEKPPLPEKDAPFLKSQRSLQPYEVSPSRYAADDYSHPQLPPMNFGHSLAINVEPPQGPGQLAGPPPAPAHSPPPPPTSKPAPGGFSDPTHVPYSNKASKLSEASNVSDNGPAPRETASKGSSPSPEQKRLLKRFMTIKELVETEHSYGQDMKVVDDIYKGTSNVIILHPEDVKILFGNSDQIVSFSTTFVDTLKQASKPVYVLTKSKRWKSNRVSNATSYSTTGDESSINGTELTDDEKDRKTFIGEAFTQHMADMEKVYTDYLKNHDSANQKLLQLQNNQKVQIWLKECKAYASDLTSAWNLDSLLVKPVQRILKYPLILDQLLELTPKDHPDYSALEYATKEMKDISMRINETKKRTDILGQANSSSRKRKDSDMRTGLAKAFGAGKKLRQQVSVTSSFEDKEYNAITDRYSEHFVRLQIMMRDVEMYGNDVENWTKKFLDFAVAMEAHIDVGQTSYPELESKWRKFRISMKEMLTKCLPDHIEQVQVNVVQPIQTLVKLHDGPQKMMAKRNKRLPDYARFRAITTRGDKPDKKTTEQGEQFIALNDTLKKEIPKMHELTGKLMERCLGNFVQAQYKWLKYWKSKLRIAVDIQTAAQEDDPQLEIIRIVRAFTQDFAFYDSQVASLAICNGALLNETPNLLTSPATSSTTMVGEPSILGDGFQSPRPGPSFERRRTHSISSEQSPVLPQPDFGDVRGNGSFFPMGDAPMPGHMPQRQVSSNRARAGSNISNTTPQTPHVPGSWRSFSRDTTPIHTVPGRPSNVTSRPTNEPGPSLRPSMESSRTNRMSDESGLTRPSPGPGYAMSSQPRSTSPGGNRFSGYFSSAMPMSDSPTMESPAEASSQPEYNVLFLAASVYEFNIDKARKEAGYPYLTYVAGEIFDVIGEKGELWLAKNQDDHSRLVGWIWNKHFVKLAS